MVIDGSILTASLKKMMSSYTEIHALYLSSKDIKSFLMYEIHVHICISGGVVFVVVHARLASSLVHVYIYITKMCVVLGPAVGIEFMI